MYLLMKSLCVIWIHAILAIKYTHNVEISDYEGVRSKLVQYLDTGQIDAAGHLAILEIENGTANLFMKRYVIKEYFR